MKAWWPALVAILVPGGLILAALELLRRRQAREHAADYVQRIQVLKTETPLALPAIKPLQAHKVISRVSRFGQRLKATR